LSVTTIKVIQRDEESAKRFQERRRAAENRKQHEEKNERHGFKFWKK